MDQEEGRCSEARHDGSLDAGPHRIEALASPEVRDAVAENIDSIQMFFLRLVHVHGRDAELVVRVECARRDKPFDGIQLNAYLHEQGVGREEVVLLDDYPSPASFRS